MTSEESLRHLLLSLDGKGYRYYRDLKREYQIGDFTLLIDHVQGDPNASPSSMLVRLPQSEAGFPADTYQNRVRAIALRDFIARRFWESARAHARGGMATGESGVISIPRPGAVIIERSSVVINKDYVEVRFSAGLPGMGRRIAGRMAAEMLLEKLPRIVDESLRYAAHNESRLYTHLAMAEDATWLRSHLEERGLVAFIADGSILPRRSGANQIPLRKGVVPFRSPDSLRLRMRLPNAGDVWGMGIPEGVTIIVGGGYHGKSTLLNAVAQGVYNHIPKDGREMVVSRWNAVKAVVEDGRAVAGVDIRPFISTLPGDVDTVAFSTDNASGSTSQAAGIMEALEVGTELLLIDEDRSASNFMVRDRRMQELVPREREPITPFIDRVRQLWEEKEISTLMVVGGSGEYLDIADTVLMMDAYEVRDVTEEARKVAAENPSRRLREGGDSFGEQGDRYPLSHRLNPRRGRKDVAIDARDLRHIQFGKGELDLTACEQLAEISQTNTLADILAECMELMDGTRSMKELLKELSAKMSGDGLDSIGRFGGSRGAVRPQEVAAAINRLRELRSFQR